MPAGPAHAWLQRLPLKHKHKRKNTPQANLNPTLPSPLQIQHTPQEKPMRAALTRPPLLPPTHNLTSSLLPPLSLPPPLMPENAPHSKLQIKQQNCKHSKDVTLSLINTTDPEDWDLILIQEPYIYPRSQLTLASQHWYTLYPSQDPDDHNLPCSLILISALLTSNSFTRICIASHIVTAISITQANTNINIYNIYNPPDTDMAL